MWVLSGRESINDRKRMVSWVLELLSVVGSVMPELALDRFTDGRKTIGQRYSS